MKKILFLSNRGLLPVVDGHTRRSFNVLKGLCENHSVYYLSLYEGEDEVSKENTEKLKTFCTEVEFFKSPSKKISIEMLWRLFLSLVTLDAYTIWRHYSGPYKKKVRELIKSGDFDIVHCDILPLTYTIMGENKIYRSVTDHDVSYRKCLSQAKTSKNIFKRLFLLFEAAKLKRLEKKTFNDVDLGIVVSEADKNDLLNLSPMGNFLVVENGVDLQSFIFGEKEEGVRAVRSESCRLVWLGGFNHYPNKQAIFYFLNEVYPLIREKIPDASINIIGGGLTKELTNFEALDSGISFKGFVDDHNYYLINSDIFVAPILSGGGTKLKILEAMAAGKAVVTTPVGAEGIDGVAGVHYLIAHDSADFVKAVCQLHNDKNLLFSLEMNSRKLILEKYDNEKIVAKINSYYENI